MFGTAEEENLRNFAQVPLSPSPLHACSGTGIRRRTARQIFLLVSVVASSLPASDLSAARLLRQRSAPAQAVVLQAGDGLPRQLPRAGQGDERRRRGEAQRCHFKLFVTSGFVSVQD